MTFKDFAPHATQEGTSDTDLVTSKETRTHWYQFVRARYRP
jgi:hypothetical protein